MLRKFFLVGFAWIVLALQVPANEKHDAKAVKNSALAQLKKLKGEWVAADEKGKPTEKLVSVFKVTSAGSAVHETIFPGTEHEMVTVYHLDGKDLVLTHYCAHGNQPHLKLDPKSTATDLHFAFVNGANIDPAKDMHMHEGSITIVDDDHITWTWQGYDNGKPDESHKISMKLVRKKP